MKMEDLMNEEREIRSAMTNRSGVLSLMLHQTICHDPQRPQNYGTWRWSHPRPLGCVFVCVRARVPFVNKAFTLCFYPSLFSFSLRFPSLCAFALASCRSGLAIGNWQLRLSNKSLMSAALFSYYSQGSWRVVRWRPRLARRFLSERLGGRQVKISALLRDTWAPRRFDCAARTMPWASAPLYFAMLFCALREGGVMRRRKSAAPGIASGGSRVSLRCADVLVSWRWKSPPGDYILHAPAAASGKRFEKASDFFLNFTCSLHFQEGNIVRLVIAMKWCKKSFKMSMYIKSLCNDTFRDRF